MKVPNLIIELVQEQHDSLNATILHLEHQLSLPEQHRVVTDSTEEQMEQEIRELRKLRIETAESLKFLESLKEL